MDEQKQELLRKAGFSLDPTIDALEDIVGGLAAEWRGTQSDKIVRQYQAVLRCLMELDWDGGLDYDAMLPRPLMPPEYWDYLKRKYPVKETTGDQAGAAGS